MRLKDLYPDQPEMQARAMDRFWPKVNIAGPNECWEWMGCVLPHGKAGLLYGRFFPIRTRGMTAHRVAFLFTHGEVPDELFVCHSCDNPPCCNPAHLWLGTAKENAQDRDRKGRQKPAGSKSGDQNPNSKLSDQIVTKARRRVIGGETIQSLADECGISDVSLGAAVRGVTWKHVRQRPATKAEITVAYKKFREAFVAKRRAA